MSEVRVTAVRDGKVTQQYDDLAVEEPLEIRLQTTQATKTIATTMRTPGNDFELVAGFLFAEGLIKRREDLTGLTYCVDKEIAEEQRLNIVNAILPAFKGSLEQLERHFTISSACGVCGKAHLDALEDRGVGPIRSNVRVQKAAILSLPAQLLDAQRVFAKTGGLHAAALFDDDGKLLGVREDVGRHNAMDKLIGWALLEGHIPLSTRIALVSGRSSFEIVQKAAVARIPVLCAVSAPSSLAVDLALRFNITLIGFLREGRFNIYSGAERIIG